MNIRLIISVLLIISIMSGIGCTDSTTPSRNADQLSISTTEPILQSDVVSTIRQNLGYVLALSYLPENYAFDGIEDRYWAPFADVALRYNSTSHYSEIILYYAWGIRPDVHQLERPGLPEIPSNAKTQVTVNGSEAYLYRGMWTQETLQKITTLQLNDLEAEWDYGDSLSIVFRFEVGQQSIWVKIEARPYDTEWIAVEDLIKIAETMTEI